MASRISAVPSPRARNETQTSPAAAASIHFFFISLLKVGNISVGAGRRQHLNSILE